MLCRVAADGITAVKTRSTFRMQCAVSADIEAAPDTVWALLTRADDMVRWNSTLTSVEGSVEPRGSVRMQVPEAPSRTFKIKVTKFGPQGRDGVAQCQPGDVPRCSDVFIDSESGSDHYAIPRERGVFGTDAAHGRPPPT